MSVFSMSEFKEAVREIVSDTLGHQTPWMDNKAAAEYIGCTPGTMKTWRARGEGPRYHVINEKLVRYHVTDLDAFVRGEVQR